MTTNTERKPVDVLIEHEGDTYRVIAKGAKDAQGRVYCHLASTTRYVEQRNGRRAVQIADWITPGALARVGGV